MDITLPILPIYCLHVGHFLSSFFFFNIDFTQDLHIPWPHNIYLIFNYEFFEEGADHEEAQRGARSERLADSGRHQSPALAGDQKLGEQTEDRKQGPAGIQARKTRGERRHVHLPHQPPDEAGGDRALEREQDRLAGHDAPLSKDAKASQAISG